MKYMDIRFSNLCNFKCRSCGPGCSSKWAEEYVKEDDGHAKLDKYFGMKTIVVSSNEDQKFMTKLKPYLRDVTEVYFAGGEVIITPEHYECLDYWIENNLTDQVELTYTTNFSVLKYKKKDLIKLWKKFSNIKIWASLDASGDQAEILRKGSDWDKILKNFQTLKQEVPHAEFKITPTISIWNVFSFPEFFDEMVKIGVIDLNSPSWDSGCRFNLLSHPWWANIQILPDHIRMPLRDKYWEYVQKYSFNEHIKNGFKTIHYTLKHGNENKGGIEEFKQYNDNIDKIRKENILKVIPELKEVYEWVKK